MIATVVVRVTERRGYIRFTASQHCLGSVAPIVTTGAANGQYVAIADLIADYGMAENGDLYDVLPEWIGALTSAPIVTDDMTIEDNGTVVVLGQVWWFPDYAVIDPVETLVNKGKVIFTAAPVEG